jgi:peptidoglycan hydrolase-like protein with peptidoglycan-binding domain
MPQLNPAAAAPAAAAPMLREGSSGPAVREMQQQLRAAGFNPGPIDGKFGPRTEAAVNAFQRARGLSVDGIVGPQTRGALGQVPGRPTAPGQVPLPPPRPQTAPAAGQAPAAQAPAAPGAAANGTARLSRQPNGPGMTTGSITVNGNTYQFNSGSSRLYSVPQGEFRVTAHRNSRSEAAFSRDGVGFSYRLEDPRRPGSDAFYDPRAGRDRTLLRIHPDGGATGTAGCIGILGDGDTMRRFREDLNAELRRNGGSYTLRVQ